MTVVEGFSTQLDFIHQFINLVNKPLMLFFMATVQSTFMLLFGEVVGL